MSIKVLNRFKLRNQIAFSFGLIFFLFMALTITATRSINQISTVTELSNSFSDNTTKILEIEKNISEIQRVALIYTKSGKKSSLKKMKQYHQKTIELIHHVKDRTNGNSNYIKRMEKIIISYGDHILELEKLYKIKQKYLTIDLPRIKDQGIIFLNRVKTKKNIDVSKLKTLLLQANQNANQFINTRNYIAKKKLLEDLNLLKIKTKDDQSLEKFNKVIEEYERTFNASVQANRMFLTLLNVVIAGDSVEISTLASKLKTASISSLNKIQDETKLLLDDSKNLIMIIIILTLLFLILIAFIFYVNVTKSLTTITKTITDFVNGNFSKEIPGIERSDEIGMLANAAESFKKQGIELLEARNEALKAQQIKSDFLANMSHEIRTPMNGILGMVSILNESKLNNEQMEMLKLITSSGDSLLTILDDILDFSKLESGKFTIDIHPFNLLDCLNEIEFMFTDAAKKKNLNFYFTIDENVPEFINGDFTRLKQVLINLCSNAIKFTSKGEVYIKVFKKDKLLYFEVTDTGVGIKKESLENLFGAFIQADTSTTREYGGTGLGLTISSKLVSLMGGKLKASSDFGIGSSFKFSIEFTEPTKDELEKVLTKKTEVQKLKWKNLKVLIAEDNKVNIVVLTRMLKKLGIDYDHGWDGEEALELFKNNSYDFILMDMQMPKLDGIATTIEIRKVNKEIPIIALTANVLKEDREKCFNAGMNEFLTKPIKLPLLTDFLNTLHISKKDKSKKNV